MCSIILNISDTGVFIAANRDEMLVRPWDMPGEYWPGVIGGRDRLAGGTWLAINRFGMMAAVLNGTGTLGPDAGKRSRGELPIMALAHRVVDEATNALTGIDTELYRSFNLVIADASGAYLLRGLESGAPQLVTLAQGVTMITSGRPNDLSLPRIARHLPKFQTSSTSDWGELLEDSSAPWDSALNIPPREGFGTGSASLIEFRKGTAPTWQFCPGPPRKSAFYEIS